MSTQAWTVDVDGVEHRISVATDPATGRTAIRVDDRMAARPMPAEETEREFSVGTRNYLLRRMPDGSFDLDIAPGDPAMLAAAARSASMSAALSPRKKQRSGAARAVPAVFFLLALACGWWAWNSSAYFRVPWQEWSDGKYQVKVDLPGAPVDATRQLKMPDGGNHEVRSFNATYRDHVYVIEHFDMGGWLHEHEAPKVLKEEITESWKGRGEIASIEETRIANRDAMRYVVNVPAEGEDPPVTLQGVALVHGPRMFFAWVETPPEDLDSADVNHFVRSVRLPFDYAYLSDGTRRIDLSSINATRARHDQVRATTRYTKVLTQAIVAGTMLVVALLSVWWVNRS